MAEQIALNSWAAVQRLRRQCQLYVIQNINPCGSCLLRNDSITSDIISQMHKQQHHVRLPCIIDRCCLLLRATCMAAAVRGRRWHQISIAVVVKQLRPVSLAAANFSS
jgi:hypothetical protein